MAGASSTVQALLEVARSRVEALGAKLSSLDEEMRALRAQRSLLREQLALSRQRRHEERGAMDGSGACIPARLGQLMEERHKALRDAESSEEQHLANLEERLASGEGAREHARAELRRAVAQVDALALEKAAAKRERQRLREEHDLEELTQNANARSTRLRED